MSVRNIFSPVASRVVRVFLIDPKRDWSILNLSKEAKTGYGHTYRVVETLLKMGLCRKTESEKVVVANAGELLSRWASYYDFTTLNKVNSYFSQNEDLDRLIRRLSVATSRDLTYALTLQAGAALVSPYVRPASLHLYVKSERMEEWHELLNLQLAELGGNVFLVNPYDEGVFYKAQQHKRVWVVSNIQLYVDLYNYPARGREAAEYLRKEAIGF